MKLGDVERVECLIAASERIRFNCLPEIYIRSFPASAGGTEGDRIIYDTVADEHRRTYGYPFDATPPADSATSRMGEVLRRTIDHIARTDPLTFGEISALISEIGVFESPTLNAGTSFPAFGLLYVRVLSGEQTWTAYLEHLVHEAAHHYLFGLWTFDPIITNEEAGR